jgi:hypothetical protein
VPSIRWGRLNGVGQGGLNMHRVHHGRREMVEVSTESRFGPLVAGAGDIWAPGSVVGCVGRSIPDGYDRAQWGGVPHNAHTNPEASSRDWGTGDAPKGEEGGGWNGGLEGRGGW